MLLSDETLCIVITFDFHYKNVLWKPRDYNTEVFPKWNPKQTRPLRRRQGIVKTLTWDALVIIYSHICFTWKWEKVQELNRPSMKQPHAADFHI